MIQADRREAGAPAAAPNLCPRCGAATRVVRTTDGAGAVVRMRQCVRLSCAHVYLTDERAREG